MTLTLYYLDNSRAFRVLWTAYELGIGDQVQVKKYARVKGKAAVPEMKSESGFSLGKSPYLVDTGDKGDEDVRVFESVACMEYLMDRYGSKQFHLLPAAPAWSHRAQVQSWISFCETTMIHSLAIMYARWFTPEGADNVLKHQEDKMSANVCKDLDLMEQAIKDNEEKFGDDKGYLVQGQFSAADVANAFSAEYILVRKIGLAGRKWPAIERWLKRIEARPAYRQTLEAAGLHDFSLLDLEKQGKI